MIYEFLWKKNFKLMEKPKLDKFIYRNKDIYDTQSYQKSNSFELGKSLEPSPKEGVLFFWRQIWNNMYFKLHASLSTFLFSSDW